MNKLTTIIKQMHNKLTAQCNYINGAIFTAGETPCEVEIKAELDVMVGLQKALCCSYNRLRAKCGNAGIEGFYPGEVSDTNEPICLGSECKCGKLVAKCGNPPQHKTTNK